MQTAMLTVRATQFGLEALQSAFSAKYYEFSAKYYELAKKCREWERFAAKLRAQVSRRPGLSFGALSISRIEGPKLTVHRLPQAEALASETRLLRGLNSQQESVIERLERENIALREEAHIREADRRRLSERVSAASDFSSAASSLTNPIF
jgi:hypothetical protein